MTREELQRKYPGAYALSSQLGRRPRQVHQVKVYLQVVWLDSVPPPTSEMIRRGAVYLGQDLSFVGTMTGWCLQEMFDWGSLGIWDLTERRRTVKKGNKHYALDPSCAHADELIHRFRPDLVI